MTTPSSNVGADASHKSVPEWAIEDALRGFVEAHASATWTVKAVREQAENPTSAARGFARVILRLARYIAEHEEAPVDPLEVEFNKWIETYCGRFDPETTAMRFTANEMRKAFMGGAKLAGESK